MPEIKNDMPEGVEFIRIGLAGDQDFELLGTYIRKGKRAGAAAQVLVRPVDGYSFQPLRMFDFREYKFVDGPEGQYMAVKQFPEPIKKKVVLSLAISNHVEEQIIGEAMFKLTQLPGYVGMEDVFEK